MGGQGEGGLGELFMRLKNPKLILLIVGSFVVLAYLAIRWASQDYERFLEQQAKKQVPVGIRDPVLWELRARMIGAGYEAGRSADLQNKPSRDQILGKARLLAKELDVAPNHLEVCIDRFKEGFYMGQLDAENVKESQPIEEVGE